MVTALLEYIEALVLRPASWTLTAPRVADHRSKVNIYIYIDAILDDAVPVLSGDSAIYRSITKPGAKLY